MSGFCEHIDEPSGSVKAGNVTNWRTNSFSKDSASWSRYSLQSNSSAYKKY
jgi:hypothetical protein